MADGDPVLKPGSTDLTTLGNHFHKGVSGDGGALVSVTKTTMSANGTFTQPNGLISIFFLDPNGGDRTFNPDGDFDDGHIVMLKNIAKRGTSNYINFDSTGSAQVVFPSRSIQAIYDEDAGEWY
jgi:hypothetical protein